MPNKTEIENRAKEIARELSIIWLRFNGNMDKLLEELAPILAKNELDIRSVFDAMTHMTEWIDDFGSVTALKKLTSSFAESIHSLESNFDKLSKELTALKESLAKRQDPRSYNSKPQPEPEPEQTKPKHLTLPGDTK